MRSSFGNTEMVAITLALLVCNIINPSVVLGAPGNFQAAVGERKVIFSWSPSNGSTSIIGYNVTCTPSPATLPQSFPQSGAHSVGGFSPQTSYNCSVAAYTSQTVGEPATVVFTTDEDSKTV